MADLTVPAILVTAVTGLVSAVVFMFYRVEQAHKKTLELQKECEAEKKALHEAHKQELRENGKALLEVNKQTLAAIDRLCELEERRHP